jgi:arginase
VPPPYSPEREPQTGIRNSEAIREYAFQLAERIQGVLAEGYFPVVLGGDCSILLGSALALRRRGRYGLFFVDGHRDFLSPATSQTGGAAGMDLALVTGRGPDVLTNLDGLKPLVRDSDVVVFGYRDLTYPAADPDYGMDDSGMTLFGLEGARQVGIREAAEKGLAALRRNGVEEFWIHLDADVLDDEMMPAVDSRQPGGMSYAELVILLRTLLASGAAVGLQITIYDPDLDPDGSIAHEFVSTLVAGFARPTTL